MDPNEPDRRTTSRPASGRLSALRDRCRAVAYGVLWPVAARVSALGDVLRSSEGRTAVLVIVAYLTGTVGLGLSVLGNPTDPNAKYGAAGIALMGITFACLFLLSISVLNATGERPHDHAAASRRGRGRTRDGEDR